VFAAGVLVLLAGLYAIVVAPQLIVRIFQAIVGRAAPRLVDRGTRLLTNFTLGLGALRSPRRFAAVFLWTLALWTVSALSFWIGFRAVGISAPFSAAVFLQSLIAIGVALPSSPGFFGLFEASAKVGLAVYGVGESQAVTWAIGYHVLSFIPITVIGAYFFGRLGFTSARSAKSTETSRRRCCRGRIGAPARPGGRETMTQGGRAAKARVARAIAPNLLLRVLAREVGSYHRIEARARGRRTAGAQARHEEAAPAEGNFADRAPAVRAAGGIGDVLRGRTAARDPVQSKQWQRHLSRGDEGTRALPRQAIRCDSSSWPLLLNRLW